MLLGNQEVGFIQFVTVHRYFNWVCQVQAALMELERKFGELQISYDEIVTYESQQSQLEHLAQTICASSAIVNKQDILSVKNMFLDTFEQLNIILIKYTRGQPDVKWCTLPSLLHSWGVALSPHLLDVISRFIVFPEEKKVLDPLDNHPIPNTSGNFHLGHNISLKLAKCFSLSDLLDLVKKLNDFLQPIMDVLDVLVFFKLHHSKVFDKYLQVHLRKESEPVTPWLPLPPLFSLNIPKKNNNNN